jgi:hypothetical protein
LREHFGGERVEDVRQEALILRHPHLKLLVGDDPLGLVVLDNLQGFCRSRCLPVEDQHQVGASDGRHNLSLPEDEVFTIKLLYHERTERLKGTRSGRG